jgi:bacterioferritin (cytochrome b1)
MANDHDKFSCNCDKCSARYNDYVNDHGTENANNLKKVSDKVLKDTLAQRLFDKIKHGDETHMEWLAKELEDFFKAKITR